MASDKNPQGESSNSDAHQFRTDGKRRYHGTDNVYFLPNDEEEHQRLDQLQYVARSLLGDNVLAPISTEPTDICFPYLMSDFVDKIVDVGCGSGKWAIEVAEQFPDAKVRGFDLSPVDRSDTPQNCEFLIGDLNHGLPFTDDSMDLVHSRIIMSGLTFDQWPLYLKEVFRILKPGTGWAQLTEVMGWPICDDKSVPYDAPVLECGRLMHQVFEVERRVYQSNDHLEGHVRDSGLVDVHVKNASMPLGDWKEDPLLKKVGHIGIDLFGRVVGPIVDSMKAKLPDDEKREEFIEAVKRDTQNPSYHLQLPMICVYGRKPAKEDQPKDP